MTEIPANEQIDAILTWTPSRLVEMYCGGRWGLLPWLWTVSIEDIKQEALRRGLACFVVPRPKDEGHWILQSASGYEVTYFERGKLSEKSTFDSLEEAFDNWLGRQLGLLQLTPDGRQE